MKAQSISLILKHVLNSAFEVSTFCVIFYINNNMSLKALRRFDYSASLVKL